MFVFMIDLPVFKAIIGFVKRAQKELAWGIQSNAQHKVKDSR